MFKSTKLRWAFILFALSATLIAIAYPVDETSAPLRQVLLTEKVLAEPAVTAASAASLELHAAPAWVASDENPFGPRSWDIPPPVAQVAPTLAVPESVQPTVPPPLPLPYRFLGRMQDDAGRLVYLGRGEQVVLARQGDVLDNTYKVVTVDDSQLEFEAIQTGLRQTLPIPTQ